MEWASQQSTYWLVRFRARNGPILMIETVHILELVDKALSTPKVMLFGYQ